MKIVIIGNGKVGFSLARELSNEGHNIVMIDSNKEVLQKSQEKLDLMVVPGNGAALEVQQNANMDEADLMISVTSSDEINILCCVLAKKLGCGNTIARVRNTEYNQQLQYLKSELGLSLTINPELTCAHQIFRSIEFPSFLKLDSFAKGRVELVELQLDGKNALTGRRIDSMKSELRRHILVCAVERGEEVIIPGGGFVFEEGDKITITAPSRDLARVINQLGISQQRIHSVMIIGGSRICEYLADDLLGVGIAVKIIESDRARCDELAEKFPKALVINDDGSNQDVLLAEGIGETDAVIAMTGVDEMNIVISMFARRQGVRKTVTKVDRNEYNALFAEMGIGSTVCPKDLISADILRYVRAMSSSGEGSAITLHHIVEGKAEAIEFVADSKTMHLGEPLSVLPLKKNILIACITRHGTVIFPGGSDHIQRDDSVIVVTTAEHTIIDINDIFTDN